MDANALQILAYVRRMGVESAIHRLAVDRAGFAAGDWRGEGWAGPSSAAIAAEEAAIKAEVAIMAEEISENDLGTTGPTYAHEEEALVSLLMRGGDEP
jgi:hypothetical protein